MVPTSICTLGFSFDGVNLMWIVIGGIAVTAIVAKSVRSVVTSNARERSRREIAAYIAAT